MHVQPSVESEKSGRYRRVDCSQPLLTHTKEKASAKRAEGFLAPGGIFLDPHTPTQSSLPFCACVQFSRESNRA